jgi:hypothetical protein
MSRAATRYRRVRAQPRRLQCPFAYTYTDAYGDANTYTKWNAESDSESYAKSNTKAATDTASASTVTG